MRKKLYKFVAIIAAVSMIFCDSSIISLAGEIVPGAEETFFEAGETDDAGDEKENVDGADEETSEEESDEVEDGEGISEEAASEENIDSEFESDETDETGEIPEDEESVEDEENAENIDAPEDGEAIDGEDISQEEVGEAEDGEDISEEESDENAEGEETEDVDSIEELLAADDNIASGKSGNVKWVIDANGKLTVSGTGNWEKYMSEYAPWEFFKDEVLTADVTLKGATDISYMFCNFENLTEVNLSGFDTSEVTNMSRMFLECKSLTTLNLSDFDTSEVTDMCLMFGGCESVSKLILTGIDTSKVENMAYMFSDCNSLKTLDLSGFNTTNVTDMSGMFSGCKTLKTLDLSMFSTAKVTDMDEMFFYCTSLTGLDLSGFNTAKVTDMNEMFCGCESLSTLNLSSFRTAKVVDFQKMFYECKSLTTPDLSNFNSSQAKNCQSMFYNCRSLTNLKLSSFRTSDSANLEDMFTSCDKLETLDIRNMTITEKSNVDDLISNLQSLTKIVSPKMCSCKLSLPVSWDGALWKDSKGIFYTELPGTSKTLKRELPSPDIIGGKSNNVIWQIDGNGKLTVSGTGDWKRDGDGNPPWYNYRDDILTAEVNLTGATELIDMFINCKNLTSVDFTGLVTSKVTGMSGMFSGCTKLSTVDLSGFDTSKLTGMSSMFLECTGLKTVNLNGFNMKNVTNVDFCFCGCTNLSMLDLSDCNWSNVTSANWVFDECTSLKRIVTPQNVKIEVELLPDKEWKDSDGNFHIGLPSNSTDLTESTASTSKYYIIYELNGGKNSDDNPKSYKKNAHVDFSDPTKEGNVFDGWYDKTTDAKVDGVQDKNITVYAKWIPYTYTLTLYGNGGKYTPEGSKKAKTVETMKVSYGEILKMKSPFERKGYTFKGWTTKKNGSGIFYKAGIPVKNLTAKNKGKVTLYAKWSPQKYQIVLDSNYYYDRKTLYTRYGKSIKLPDKPFENYGYSFKGWSLTPDGPVKYKNKASVKNLATSGEVRLYAVWSINTYNVKFSGNGVGKGKAPATQKGCRFNEPDCKMPENTFTYNDKLYRFDGWNTRKDGRGLHYTGGGQTALNASKNKQTIILYARWLYEYSIATDAGVVNDEAYYNESISTETMDKYFTGLAREGYYIAGWATNQKNADKGKMTYKSSFKNVAGKTLYPVYKPIKYTVKFDANGGTGKMSSMTATYDNKAEIGKDKPLSVTNKDVITLYAVWEKLP